MYNISPELQVRVEVLKDMLMYRVDKRQCILTNDELQSSLSTVTVESFQLLIAFFTNNQTHDHNNQQNVFSKRKN